MMDDRTAETCRTFLGHNGPVYRCSYSPDKTMMLSCSEDTTIRLWSLQTWTCVVVYRGHQYPIWDVRFSPHGHYFATCSHDKTARLWATDNNQPLRIFCGHYSDVDVSSTGFIDILIVVFNKYFLFSAFYSIPIRTISQLVPVIELFVYGIVCLEITCG